MKKKPPLKATILKALAGLLIFASAVLAGEALKAESPADQRKQTHYLGRAAADLPAGFAADNWPVELIWLEPTRQINLVEMSFDSEDGLARAAAQANGIMLATETENLRDFGCPARLHQVLFRGDCQLKLALALKLKGGAGLLLTHEFFFDRRTPKEELTVKTAEQKAWFLARAKELAAGYEYQGDNRQPPAGRLATRLGRLNLGGLSPEPLAVFRLFFKMENQDSPVLTLIVTAFEGAAPTPPRPSLVNRLSTGLLFHLEGVKKTERTRLAAGRTGRESIMVKAAEDDRAGYYEAFWFDDATGPWTNDRPKIECRLFTRNEEHFHSAAALWNQTLDSLKMAE